MYINSLLASCMLLQLIRFLIFFLVEDFLGHTAALLLYSVIDHCIVICDLSDMLFSSLQVHMNLMQTSHEFLMQFFMNLMQIYESVTEGSYIKMIDMVSDQGGQMQVSALACVTL